MKRWYRFWPRRGVVSPERWRDIACTPLLRALPAELSSKLYALSNEFLSQKRIEGAAGLELAADAELVIAAQAALPLLGLDMSWYRGWYSVVVYPGEFRRRGVYEDDIGVVHEASEAAAGEAWPQGPIIVSWEDAVRDLSLVEPGRNVTIHECAHKLDMLKGGVANGFPPLHPEMSAKHWTGVFESAWERHCEAVDRHRDTTVDPYGAEAPGEFFATVCELFFTMPAALQCEHLQVYSELKSLFRVDPVSWAK